MTDFYFKSDLFEIEPGEDEETNPGLYGKQLSNWLKMKLEGAGYLVEEVIPEDWGWCVMCQRAPYSLWVGCGNMEQNEPGASEIVIPNKDEITWQCFIVAEVPFLKRIFGKVDTSEGINKLARELERIFTSEPGITLVGEP